MLFTKLFQSSPQLKLPDIECLKARLVVLRRKKIEDLDADFKWRMDAELTKLDTSLPIAITKEQYLAMLQAEINGAVQATVKVAIDTVDDSTHIGNCMLYNIESKDLSAEYGIMIGDRHYWNRGYGADATTAMINFTFSQTPLKHIYLHTLKDNLRAQTSFGKAGFEPVTETNNNGRSLLKMTLSRSQWIANTDLSRR